MHSDRASARSVLRDLAHWEARKKGAAKDRRQFAYSVLAVLEQWEEEAD